MKVVLLHNVKGIGRVGDVKDVSDGYARNFLFPRGAAKPATEGTLREATTLRQGKLASLALANQAARELAATLSGTRVEISGRANAQGRLFAAISEVQIGGRTFALPEPLKNTGEHPVRLELAAGVSADITVVLKPL